MFCSYIIVGFAVILCTYAQVSLSPGHIEKMKIYPYLKFSKQARHPRDVTWEEQVERVKLSKTLGNDESSISQSSYYRNLDKNMHLSSEIIEQDDTQDTNRMDHSKMDYTTSVWSDVEFA